MLLSQLAYAPGRDATRLPVAVSIFADRAHVRGQLAEDVADAGFHLLRNASLAEVLADAFDGAAAAADEIVLLDCPRVDGATLAALSRLDMHIARSGASLVVSTTIEALEDVFACLDQSQPRILVDPTRGERVVALGHELANVTKMNVREQTEEDRIALLRLSEQVAAIARKLDDIVAANGDDGGFAANRLAAPSSGYSGEEPGQQDEPLAKPPRPPLPDPRLVRQIIRQRQARSRYFDGDLFADPAWDMLLDLTAARVERQRVSITSLCIASGVPPTTALRWITQLIEMGLFERVEDEQDRRRAFIALSDRAAEAMARYFADLGRDAGRLV